MATSQPPRRQIFPPPSASSSGGVSRPPSERQLPRGYSPHYRSDLQQTGAIVRNVRRTALSRRQILWLAGGVFGFVVVVTAALVIVISSLIAQSAIASPDSALSTFYSSLRAQDYDHAYSLTSSSYRGSHSETSFEDHYRQLDVIDGPITTFTLKVTSNSGGHATVTANVTRGNAIDQQIVDTVSMVQSNGSWLVESITSTSTPANTPPAG